jgi:hypothetical protein
VYDDPVLVLENHPPAHGGAERDLDPVEVADEHVEEAR